MVLKPKGQIQASCINVKSYLINCNRWRHINMCKKCPPLTSFWKFFHQKSQMNGKGLWRFLFLEIQMNVLLLFYLRYKHIWCLFVHNLIKTANTLKKIITKIRSKKLLFLRLLVIKGHGRIKQSKVWLDDLLIEMIQINWKTKTEKC